MSLRASLMYRSDYGDIELTSVIDPGILRAIKDAALRNSLHKMAENEGDEVREMKFNAQHECLRKILDYVLP